MRRCTIVAANLPEHLLSVCALVRVAASISFNADLYVAFHSPLATVDKLRHIQCWYTTRSLICYFQRVVKKTFPIHFHKLNSAAHAASSALLKNIFPIIYNHESTSPAESLLLRITWENSNSRKSSDQIVHYFPENLWVKVWKPLQKIQANVLAVTMMLF